jgi:hypothetical protein
MHRLVTILMPACVLLSCGSTPSSGPSTTAPTPTTVSAIPETIGTLTRFQDMETGSTWNIKGVATDGPLKGRHLEQIPAYTAYWFAWASFWPDTEIFGVPKSAQNQLAQMVQNPVPTREIFADVPADAIPPLDDPPGEVGKAEFIAASVADLADNDIVIGVEIEGDARAYPTRILNWHEIVNHTVCGRKISLTYCPLTASGINFDGSEIAFGNSGALFNNNMVMYNRATRNLWSQMWTYGISGQDVGTHTALLPVVQGTWGAWKAMYPETKVLATTTGYARNYSGDIYIERGYTENNQIWFAQEPEVDSRYHPKEWTLGLLSQSRAKAYPFVLLGDDGVTNDSFEDMDIVIVYDRQAKMAIPYNRKLGDRVLTFEALTSSDP